MATLDPKTKMKGDCGHVGSPQDFTVIKGTDVREDLVVCKDCSARGIGEVLRVASEKELFVVE